MTMTTCAQCGYDNVPNTLFCEECGAEIDAPEARAPQSGPLHDAPPAPVAPPARVERAVRGTGGLSDAFDLGAGDTTIAGEAFRPATAAYLTALGGRRLDIPARDVVIVGREDMRSGIRPDVDLTLDGAGAAGVSRRHCRLLRHADGWLVEDLMSTNYTVLNGTALPAHTPTPLRDGDELRLGKLRLRFHAG